MTSACGEQVRAEGKVRRPGSRGTTQAPTPTRTGVRGQTGDHPSPGLADVRVDRATAREHPRHAAHLVPAVPAGTVAWRRSSQCRSTIAGQAGRPGLDTSLE